MVGYSESVYENRPIFIRHFTQLNQAFIDCKYADFLDYFIKEGIQTEEEQLKNLIANEIWSQAKEDAIAELRTKLGKLRDTYDKLLFDREKNSIQKDIASTYNKLRDLIDEREILIGKTADSFADKKINELYVFESLFKSPALKENFFSKDEFENLEEEELSRIISLYNSVTNNLAETNIQKVALLRDFQGYLNLCNEDCSNFFGKPIVDLTFYQCHLLSHGRTFRHILSSDKKPPQDALNDPTKLLEWYSGSRKIESAAKSMRQDGAAVGFVGATNDEVSRATGTQVASLSDISKSSGGKLSKEQMINFLKGG